MPATIVVGLVALIVALIIYTMGSVGAFRSKSITRRHVTYLWIGVGFDVLATAMMAIEAGGLDVEPLADLLHTIVAFVALLGMVDIAAGGTWAIGKGNDKMRATIAKWALAPWALWVFVFLWGMVVRGLERMG